MGIMVRDQYKTNNKVIYSSSQDILIITMEVVIIIKIHY